MPLSERLTAVAGMVTPGLAVADTGCDHGYLGIHLIKNDISPRIIAMDINRGPLMKASENIRRMGLSEKIDTRLSDGLKELIPGEVQCCVMAGMGGRLMIRIMAQSEDVCEALDELILQPQSDAEAVRHYLEDKGYRIVAEDIVYEDDKFYPMMKAVHGKMELEKDIYYRYGRLPFEEKHPILYKYLIRELNLHEGVLSELEASEDTERVAGRTEEVRRDISLIREAIQEHF